MNIILVFDSFDGIYNGSSVRLLLSVFPTLGEDT